MSPDTHLDDALLAPYLQGGAEDALQPVRAHLVKCRPCRKKAAAKWKQAAAPQGLEGFTVHELLRADAFRQVFKATHQASGATVVIEVLRGLTIDSPLTEKVLAAARAAEALAQPGVCAVLGLGYLPVGTPWVAMEWLEGVTLDGVLTRERMARLDVLGLLCGVVEPLVALHKANLAHGHLIASLVMVAREPRELVLLDATLAMPEAGTVPADDLFALGGILFEALTGQTPTNSPSLPPLEPTGLTALVLGLLDPHGPSRPSAEATFAALVSMGAKAARPGPRPRSALTPLAPLKRPPAPPPIPLVEVATSAPSASTGSDPAATGDSGGMVASAPNSSALGAPGFSSTAASPFSGPR